MALTSLLVCADKKAVQTLSRLLRNLDIEVSRCDDAEAARKLLSTADFDALLVDCHDEEAACDLIAWVRQNAVKPNCVVLALLPAKVGHRDMFAAGANFVIYKPLSDERANACMTAARDLIERERRSGQRVLLSGSASVACSDFEKAPATLLDISEDGIAIQSERPLPSAGRIYLQFALPGQRSAVHIAGYLAWQDGLGRNGLRFAELPQASRRALREWIAMEAKRLKDAGHSKLPQTNVAAGLALLSSSLEDRRFPLRKSCNIGVQVFRAGQNIPLRSTLRDIGHGGAYIETFQPYPVGTSLDVVLHTHEVKLALLARVQSSHPGLGMGVKFTLRSSEQRQQLGQIVDSVETELATT
jgi:CheY-like chemotaxis protein